MIEQTELPYPPRRMGTSGTTRLCDDEREAAAEVGGHVPSPGNRGCAQAEGRQTLSHLADFKRRLRSCPTSSVFDAVERLVDFGELSELRVVDVRPER